MKSTNHPDPTQWLLLGAFILASAGCSQPTTSQPPPAIPPTATPDIATRTSVEPLSTDAAQSQTLPEPTMLPEPEPKVMPEPTQALQPTPSATHTATPDPYLDLTIDALAARAYGGGIIEIVDTLEITDTFTRYLIKYPSDGLDIYGFMNVPIEGDKFPVALVLHGYIDPDEYDVVPYTRRYADALAEAGYFVIHPNFRNYPPSDSGPDPYRIGYATDVLNLVAIVREQSQDPLGTMRRADSDSIHLWGHSMGGGVALRVLAVNNEPYLKSAVVYGSMSGDESLNYGRIRSWTNSRNGSFELNAPPETLDAISPINSLDRTEAAVAVHHSYEDDVVPVEWSELLCAKLDELFTAGEIPYAPACYFYDLQPHTFRGNGDSLFVERTIEFFNEH